MAAPIVNPLPYDNTNPNSILEYAQRLKGKTFWQVLEEDPNLSIEQKNEIRKNFDIPKNKWRYGHFIEENFFYYNANSDKEADFPKAWVELKVSPYLKNSNGLRVKERLVLTIINYMEDYNIPFEKSHLLQKCALMLFVYYFYDENKSDDDYLINYVDLFQFPKSDYEIIKRDYNTIINKIKEWKAHEISEWDTIYLWACTKWANSNTVREQPNSPIQAKQRAFCLKNSYMNIILNEYLVKNIHTYIQEDKETKDSLLNLQKEIVTYWKTITDFEELKKQWFEKYIIWKISPFYGKKVSDLFDKFEVNSTAKSNYYMLTKKILWVKEDKIEEFEKANIEIKTIRLKKDWTPKEAMSFPAFKYNEIINQEFYDSDLYNEFSEKKFLFVIYQYTDTDYKNKTWENLILKNAMFWNVPMADIDWKIREWREETVSRIRMWEYNNLIKTSDDTIIHVRPHWRDSHDTFPTPDWWQATKKCFWFNIKYIKEQIEKWGN